MPVKTACLLLALVLISADDFAQTLSQSPYGRYATGDQLPQTNHLLNGLGGASVAFSDSNNINTNQPASLTSIGSGITIFDAGFTGLATEYSTDLLKATGRTAGFGYLAFAFPIIKKRWTASLNLTPLSNSGFTLKDSSDTGAEGRTFYNYVGTGGYSSAGFANGIRLTRDIHIGVQARYIFGKSDYSSQVFFPDNGTIYRGGRITSSKRLSDIDFTFGLTAQHRFRRPAPRIDTIFDIAAPNGYRIQVIQKDSIHLKFGAVFTPSVSASASNTYLAESFFTSGSSSFTDTILYKDNQAGTFILPMQAAAGFTIGNCYNKWLVTTEFRYTDWNGFRIFDKVDSVRSSYRASLGFQWIPRPLEKGSYFSKVRYRLGGYYSDGYLKINNQAVPEMGISLGFGLPFELQTYARKVATSLLSISISAGQRGMPQQNLLVERYLKVGIGFSLNDRWFNRTRFE